MMLRFHDDFYKFSCDPPYLSHQPFLHLLPSFPIAHFFFVKASFTFRSPRLQRSRFVVRVPRGLSSAPLDVNFSLARNLLFIRQPRVIPLVAFLLRFLLGSFANVPSTSRSPSLFLFFKPSLLSLPHPIFCTCFLHRANKFFLLFGTVMGELRLEISHSLSPNKGASFLSLFVAPSHFLPSPPPASLFVALIPFVFSPTLPFCRSSANAPTSMHPIFAAKTKLLQRQIRKLFAYISPFIFILLC